jgi:hypothetical protein
MSTSTTSTTSERALSLLGQGVPPVAVANALGVDQSRITQLLSDPEFAVKVIELKFEALSKHNQRDQSIDGLEDKLLDKLRDCLPYMTRPMEILKSFSVINAAKRRGTIAQDGLIGQKQTIIQLNIPQIVIDKFQTNIHNQVVQVGQQSLLTIQSGQLLKTVDAQNVRNRKESVQTDGTAETDGNEQASRSGNLGEIARQSISQSGVSHSSFALANI